MGARGGSQRLYKNKLRKGWELLFRSFKSETSLVLPPEIVLTIPSEGIDVLGAYKDLIDLLQTGDFMYDT